MQAALLEDRGVIEVGGPEAEDLLQRLFTNDVLGLEPAEARYAALLSPQGKILADFLAVAGSPVDEGTKSFLLDCPLQLAPDLVRRLMLYRLRARVTIADRSGDLGVAAFWPDAPDFGGVYRDPRSADLGFRLMAPHAELAALAPTGSRDIYRCHRIRAGIPEGGVDFAYGETFPHEANLDRLHGVDFTKGCYVGQEVVSRVQHRGTARKRVALVSFEGDPPPVGAEIVVGEIAIGTMGSSMRGQGLAMIRTDRAAEAAALGAAVTSAGTKLMIAVH